MTLVFVAAALAGSVFKSVDAETTLGMGGTWARVHAVDGGYWFFQVAGGDGWVEDIGEDLTGYNDRDRVQLSHVANIQDAQFERCPDGGWLLLGSYTVDAFDDSAKAWRFDADFNELWSVTAADRDSKHKHNDMVPVCTSTNEGAIFAGTGGGGGSAQFLPLEGGVVGTPVSLSLSAEGASMAEYGDAGGSIVVDTNGTSASGVVLHFYDKDWKPLDDVSVALGGGNVKWPERIQAMDDGWLLTYLVNSSNTPLGDVWLAALDADFKLVDQVEVHAGGEADNRPWFARHGTTVAVSYDRDVQPRITLVNLVDGADGGDDGIPDTAGGGDDTSGGGGGGDSAGDTAGMVGGEKECLCASTSAIPLVGAIGLSALGVARRRRR